VNCPICHNTNLVNFQGAPETCPVCEGETETVTIRESAPVTQAELTAAKMQECLMELWQLENPISYHLGDYCLDNRDLSGWHKFISPDLQLLWPKLSINERLVLALQAEWMVNHARPN
jgi:hypothetical protein